ncbi:hypothetical protein [Globicatella sp. PHS-GS-PNBC-21-1553]|uniref:hypothetical protein n=1 Tax=Globicatella sp. PHS-GS-PNBC-21-1553 TaxID=2885764 RepID=UPI00298F1377|nr:hypothetical protein [Globicatella sp. PHS-GS-PNBC-21-1553]WPC08599.1 hypothetical protein LB888_11520 [Globicatella sp. PHS-GS-PNBC-21-1553]
MGIILRNQVNESEYVVYSFTEDEKMMVQLKSYADNSVVRELYYDLSKVEQGKMYELDEYVISVSRTDNGLELTLINFVQEVDYTDEDIELDVEYSEFDSDEWNVLKEMEVTQEVNLFEENDRLKSEIHELKQQVADGKRENEQMLLEHTQENELLTKKIDVLSEQLDFRDELIQELALMVYA